MLLTGSLSDLSEATERHPGSRRPLTQMTNAHWAFPIPLLSVRTNTAHFSCVCVCMRVKGFSTTVVSNKWHMNGHIYLFFSQQTGECISFSVKNEQHNAYNTAARTHSLSHSLTHSYFHKCIFGREPTFSFAPLTNPFSWNVHSSQS